MSHKNHEIDVVIDDRDPDEQHPAFWPTYQAVLAKHAFAAAAGWSVTELARQAREEALAVVHAWPGYADWRACWEP